ncbi:MAG: hypothetical protein ABS936_09395 [Exiguobacterium indicum]
MRRYKEMILVGGIAGVTLLSYFGYAASIKGSDYEVENVQKGTADELKKIKIEIENGDIKPTQYHVQLDGQVDSESQNYITGLFNNYAADFPSDFYRFISKEDVFTSEIGPRTYGIKMNATKLDYHSYDKSTQKQFKKTLDYRLAVPDHETSEVRVFYQDGMKVYVQWNDRGAKEKSTVLLLNLAKGKVETLHSKRLENNRERQYVVVNPYGIVYREITYDAEGIDKDSAYYLDNGKSVKRLKSLDAYAAEGNFSAADDDHSLIAYGTFDSESSKSIKWSTYDFKTNQVKQHEVEGQHTYRFNGSHTMIVKNKLYHIANINDSDFQVTVIDTKNESITYQGIIKDKNAKKNRLIQDVTVTK